MERRAKVVPPRSLRISPVLRDLARDWRPKNPPQAWLSLGAHDEITLARTPD